MQTNAELTAEYLAIIDELEGDVTGRRAAFDYMANSTAIVHHQVVACSFLPRLFNERTYRTLKETAETMHGILVKVMQRYLDDPDYRSVFSFDPRLEELILLPRGYDALLPFARVDVFLDEDTYDVAFCEFNADGSSGMNENREITLSVARSESFKRFAARHRIEACELFSSWVDEFMRIYGTYEHRIDNPRVAIVDFLENAVIDEFRVFARLFKSRGVPCSACDMRELTFDGTALRDAEGNQIHAVWRRCVTNDVIEHWEESQALIEAVRAEKVALIGSFAGHIVHDKQIFEALFHPKTRALLTDEENALVERTIPKTTFLDDAHADLAEVRANKDAWIVKPTDHYGASDVYAGAYYSAEEWNAIIDRFANGAAGEPFLVQRYITPYRTLTLPPDTHIAEQSDDEARAAGAAVPYNNLSGLYLYNGKFQGVFSRLGPRPTISKDMAGITAATIWVDCDTEADTGENGDDGAHGRF